MTNNHQVVIPQPLTGILLKISAVAIFVGMQSFIKLAGEVPTGQIVFFRSFFAMFPVFAMLAWRRELAGAFRTARPSRHIFRGLCGVSSMMLGFFALTRLPLPEAIMLNYAQPLLVVAISALVLGETVRVYRWSAVVVGLVGVAILSWPKLTLFAAPEGMGSDQALGVAAALVAAAISAVAVLQVTSLVATERSATIVLWFSLTSTVASFFTIPFGWSPLAPMQIVFLIACGFAGGVAQILMTESYRHASAATVAPFEYTSILFGFAIGYLLFGDLPTVHAIVGGAIVVGSGLFIIWREQRLGLARARTGKITPPQ